jgi:hypothetical protein
MRTYTSEDIRGYARWLTQACQAAGLNAEQYGAEVLIQGTCSHLNERVTCRPDTQGQLRWFWSWGMPIGLIDDSSQALSVENIDELVRAIKNVVTVSLPRTERY